MFSCSILGVSKHVLCMCGGCSGLLCSFAGDARLRPKMTPYLMGMMRSRNTFLGGEGQYSPICNYAHCKCRARSLVASMGEVSAQSRWSQGLVRFTDRLLQNCTVLLLSCACNTSKTTRQKATRSYVYVYMLTKTGFQLLWSEYRLQGPIILSHTRSPHIIHAQTRATLQLISIHVLRNIARPNRPQNALKLYIFHTTLTSCTWKRSPSSTDGTIEPCMQVA